MGASLIEWTDRVWNPVTGCGPGLQCYERCYARRFANRLRGRFGYPADDPFRVTFHPDRLELPLGWRRPCRVFVDSMGDLFRDDVPETIIAAVFGVMSFCGHLTFQILTKRPERMREFIASTTLADCQAEACVRLVDALERGRIYDSRYINGPWPLPNVWLGVSVEDQKAADERVPALCGTAAAVRFVSCEPLLGPLSLRPYDDFSDYGHGECWLGVSCNAAHSRGIDWIIAGGENGPGARPCHIDWVRSLRDQCVAAGVPFFFKNWGAWVPLGQYPPTTALQDCHDICNLRPDGTTQQRSERNRLGQLAVGRCGAKLAGDLLDDRQWKQMPAKEDK